MIHEIRIYDAAPGKLPALNDRFANITLGYFEKHGIKSIAYWTDVIGISGRLTYIVAFEDLGHRESRLGELRRRRGPREGVR